MKEEFKKAVSNFMNKDLRIMEIITPVVLFISLNTALIALLYTIIQIEILGEYTIQLSVLILVLSQLLIINLVSSTKFNSQFDYVLKPTNEHDIDNKLRILKEEIDRDIFQKLYVNPDANVEATLKKCLDEKLDMNIVETLGERVQSVSSDFALAKRLSHTVEQAYERIARLNSGYHDLYEKFLKSYRFFGIMFALIGVAVPSVCLWFHIQHIINNDTSYLEKFTYHIYLPIIPFTFLCVSLSIIMFSLSAKAQEKIESYTKELNTLLMKATGARLLILTTDKKQMIKAGEKFMEVERNFVLKKGERTIEQGNNELNISLIDKQNNMIMNLIKELGKNKKDG